MDLGVPVGALILLREEWKLLFSQKQLYFYSFVLSVGSDGHCSAASELGAEVAVCTRTRVLWGDLSVLTPPVWQLEMSRGDTMAQRHTQRAT